VSADDEAHRLLNLITSGGSASAPSSKASSRSPPLLPAPSMIVPHVYATPARGPLPYMMHVAHPDAVVPPTPPMHAAAAKRSDPDALSRELKQLLRLA